MEIDRNKKYYHIKIDKEGDRCYVGWSGSSWNFGFFTTTHLICTIFSEDVLDDKYLKEYLKDKSYTLVEAPEEKLLKRGSSYFYR